VAEPSRRPSDDFLIGSPIAIDGALEQQLSLLLRGHGLQGFEVVL
jgi:hypothetical protein